MTAPAFAQSSSVPAAVSCLFCKSPVVASVVDLGKHPLCQSILTAEGLDQMEPFYPLHAKVCEQCWLVQVHEYVRPEEIFTEYAYFSGYSDSWLAHARAYVEMISERLGLGPDSQVIELGSNDGYLLQYFVGKGIRALGVEPAANVARVAVDKGIPTLVRFFGDATAHSLLAEGKRADLVCGANVFAQVPDPNDFVAGIKTLLKPEGVVTIEFPHLLQLLDQRQFDTIYHEHFSYFSLRTASRIFEANRLTIFDVEELPTHGGSLRIYARHTENVKLEVTERARDLAELEKAEGLDTLERYQRFASEVERVKLDVLSFLIEAKRQGKTVAGYGAPGKGNTLINYCGIRQDLLAFTVDRNPYKAGKFLPGSHIPVLDPSAIATEKPDYLFILPWNLRKEIMSQMEGIRAWGGKFVIPIPTLEVL